MTTETAFAANGDSYPLFADDVADPHLPVPLEGNELAGAVLENVVEHLHDAGLTDAEVMDELHKASHELDEQIALFDAPDEELLAKLDELGLPVDLAGLEERMHRHASEGELVAELARERGVVLDEDEFELALMVCGALWESLLPDDPSEASFLAYVQSGYDCIDEDPSEALDLWAQAWTALERNMRVRGALRLPDYHGCFDMEATLEGWARTYKEKLEQEAGRDPRRTPQLEKLREDLERLGVW